MVKKNRKSTKRRTTLTFLVPPFTFYKKMKLITIDIEKCTGCRICELVCVFNKEKIIRPFLSRITIIQNWQLGLSIPVVCQQCEDAPCLKTCPASAIYRNYETYAIEINEKKCIGCRQCTFLCPFGAIVYSTEKKKILKCDLCHGEPLCVKYCPTEAIEYKEPEIYNLKKRRLIAETQLKYLLYQESK